VCSVCKVSVKNLVAVLLAPTIEIVLVEFVSNVISSSVQLVDVMLNALLTWIAMDKATVQLALENQMEFAQVDAIHLVLWTLNAKVK